MRTRKLSVLVLLLVISITTLMWYFSTLEELIKPFWLRPDIYMSFEQVFAWASGNRTEYMVWNVTMLNGDFADLHLFSHGVQVSGGEVEVTIGEADWEVNVLTREITTSSDRSNVGKKVSFWIPVNVKLGSVVDVMYGQGRINGSELVEALKTKRDCWVVVAYDWPTSQMTRYYDKSSGICLKTHAVLTRENITVSITETALQTNIDLQASAE